MAIKIITNKSQPLIVNALDTIILELIRSYENNAWPVKNGGKIIGLSKIRLQELLRNRGVMPKRMDTLNNHLKKLQSTGLIKIFELSPGVIYLQTVEIDMEAKQ